MDRFVSFGLFINLCHTTIKFLKRLNFIVILFQGSIPKKFNKTAKFHSQKN